MSRRIPGLWRLKRWWRYASFGRAYFESTMYRDAWQAQQREVGKTPSRTDIINFLVSQFTRPVRYLEIGVRNPNYNFNRIAADWKCSVDPGLEFAANPVTFAMTSDAFFEGVRLGTLLPPDVSFDIIFIDGLHLAEQVDRDITNALSILAPDGFIVLHDCNPPSEWHARDEFAHTLTPAGPMWNGTTWKAFLRRRFDPTLSSCCVDTDYGVGVIAPSRPIGAPIAPVNPFFEYHVLANNRAAHLHLVSFQEFTACFDQAPT